MFVFIYLTSSKIYFNLINDAAYYTQLSIHIDGLAQECSISSALAIEMLQSCTKPSM